MCRVPSSEEKPSTLALVLDNLPNPEHIKWLNSEFPWRCGKTIITTGSCAWTDGFGEIMPMTERVEGVKDEEATALVGRLHSPFQQHPGYLHAEASSLHWRSSVPPCSPLIPMTECALESFCSELRSPHTSIQQGQELSLVHISGDDAWSHHRDQFSAYG
mmetsp:Transcript_4834/g.7749  ORF Transcript_4834/g.7749 Transcript_4834/m.7749 type:complete len:160 (-) Transcript_4834:105-584(-)